MAGDRRDDRLKLEPGDVAPAALLVAGSEQLIIKVAAPTQELLQIEGLSYQQVAPGVIRAAVALGAAVDAGEAGRRLLSLRGRLDRQSVASAIEWPRGSTGATRTSESATADSSPVDGGGNICTGDTAALLRSGSEQCSPATVLDKDVSREVLRRASDEDLASELLRRATSRGIGAPDLQRYSQARTTPDPVE